MGSNPITLTIFSQMLHGNLNFLFLFLFFSVDGSNFVTALLIISERSIDKVGLFSLLVVQNHLRPLLTEALSILEASYLTFV